MNRYPLYIILSLLLSISSCRPDIKSTSKTKTENQFDKLVGVWEMVAKESNNERKFREEWEKANDSTFYGSAYLLGSDASDRFNTELLRLNRYKNTWYLHAQLAKQNKVVFTNTVAESSTLLFENPEHDFPKYIKYTWLDDQKFEVEIGDTSKQQKWQMALIE